MQMCTRARRLYPRHLFVKNRLRGVRSCSSSGASVSLGERANISAGHGEYLPLSRYFQQLHVQRACAACMPRYHGGGAWSVGSVHMNQAYCCACDTHHGSMARRLFVPFVWSLEVKRGYATVLHSHCQTVLTLTHYFLSAHVTVMA